MLCAQNGPFDTVERWSMIFFFASAPVCFSHTTDE